MDHSVQITHFQEPLRFSPTFLTFPFTSLSFPSMSSLYFSTSSLVLVVSLSLPLSSMFFCVSRFASLATSCWSAEFCDFSVAASFFAESISFASLRRVMIFELAF